MRDYLQNVKRFHRNVRFFFLAIAVHGFTFFGIFALLLNLYLLRRGYGSEFIGLVNGIAPLMLAIFSLPAGAASRRWGSRQVMSRAYVAIAASFALVPLSEALPLTLQQPWIVAANALGWTAGAFVIVNFSPYLMAWTGEEERSLAFAVQGATFPVAGFLGSLLGGTMPGLFAAWSGLTLDSSIPYRNSLLVAAVIQLLAVAAIRQIQEISDTTAGQQDAGSSRSSPPYRLMLLFGLITILYVAGEWTMRVYFNVYLDTALTTPTTLIGALSAGALLMGLTAFLAPQAEARWGLNRVVLGMMLGGFVAFLPLIFIAHWLAVGLGYMLLVGAVSLMYPPYAVFSQSTVSPEWRTAISSAIAMAVGLGIALTSLGGGMVVATFGFQTLFVMGAGFFVLAAGVFWLAFSAKAGTSAPPLPDAMA